MLLVPVIDLMKGAVVRAVRGERQSYRPVLSRLCAGSEPVAIARALCRHCDARHLYVADLDALLGGAAQIGVLDQLLRALPGVELWLDAGFTGAAQAVALCAALGDAAERVVPVFGSESLASRDELERCLASRPDALLSLDRRDGRELDAAGAWTAPELWPSRVIMMTLERVGADAGPDLDTLRALQHRSPATRFIGAGGIRQADDLARARDCGAYAWLVASALHDGRLPPVGAPAP